jgi:hypothetical protein
LTVTFWAESRCGCSLLISAIIIASTTRSTNRIGLQLKGLSVFRSKYRLLSALNRASCHLAKIAESCRSRSSRP